MEVQPDIQRWGGVKVIKNGFASMSVLCKLYSVSRAGVYK